jgi:4-hydroxy-tetrahydrodipicolinate reductase
MVRIILSGCNGKMGQVVTRLAKQNPEVEIVAGIDINDSSKNDYPVFKDATKCNIEGDVIIDFSNPGALEGLLKLAIARKLPLVMATTGFSEIQKKQLKEASSIIPVFQSANMSLGVNLLIDLVKKAAKNLENYFDIEIIEKHHNQKVDAPSGTALAIADAINDTLEKKQEYIYDRHARRMKRSKTEIGIHAVRGGTIVGEHSVIFAGNDEIIELKHTAMSKDIFAIGAIKVAVFLFNKKAGLYSMNDLF